MWADAYIKPLLRDPKLSAEISAVNLPARGTAKKDYVLSRDIAAELAMLARTEEGKEVRRYFLDMEKLAVRLSGYLPFRAQMLTTTDGEMTHYFRKKAGDLAKAGDIPKYMVGAVASEKDRKLKSFVSRLLTGKPARYWREALGGHRGIRDVLNAEDLAAYARCYDFAGSLIRGGIVKRADLENILRHTFHNLIDISDYLPELA